MFKRKLKMLKTRGTRREDAEPVKVVAKGTAVEAELVWNAVIVLECEVLPALATVEFKVKVLLRVAVSDTTTEVVVVSGKTGPGAVTVVSIVIAVTVVCNVTVVVSLPGTIADNVLKIVVVEVDVVGALVTTEDTVLKSVVVEVDAVSLT